MESPSETAAPENCKLQCSDIAKGSPFELFSDIFSSVVEFSDMPTFGKALVVSKEFARTFEECGEFWRTQALRRFPLLGTIVPYLQAPVNFKDQYMRHLLLWQPQEPFDHIAPRKTLDDYVFSFEISTTTEQLPRSFIVGKATWKEDNTGASVCFNGSISYALWLQLVNDGVRVTWMCTCKETGKSSLICSDSAEDDGEALISFGNVSFQAMVPVCMFTVIYYHDSLVDDDSNKTLRLSASFEYDDDMRKLLANEIAIMLAHSVKFY